MGDPVIRDIVDGTWAEPSGDAESTVGEGQWAIPGLVDAHTHLAADRLPSSHQPGSLEGAKTRAQESLQAGVTLVLDKGWCDDTVVQLIEAVDTVERPDVEAAAHVIAVEGGYYRDFALEVDGEDLDSVVRDQAKAGSGWVKVIGDWPRRGVGPLPNFDESQLRRAVDTARDHGARVAIHTMARDVPSIAVAAGVQSIEHGLFLTEDDLAVLGERGGIWVPTLLRVEAMLEHLGEGSTGGRLFVDGLANVRSILPLANEAGVHVLAGTDLVGSPANVAAEARRLAAYGMSNRQVVESISRSAFVATGRDPDFAPGSPANAVFFDDDPVRDLTVLTRPARVIRLGRIL